jgi:hypothetical protein
MAIIANHEDCDLDTGFCAVFPGTVHECPHGDVRARCGACLNDAVDREARMAEVEERFLAQEHNKAREKGL